MSQRDVDIVLNQFAATNERDFARAMTYYAENVELEVHAEAFLERGTFSGRETVGEWFGNWFATFEPGYHFDITEARDLGGVVLLVATHQGRGRASGADVRGETAYLYKVRDGKIVRAELYRDRATALRAAGLQK
jgi:ketosteroid isomerase-like protein